MTSKQEFNCVFCNDIFDNKEELQEHFRKHGDPNYKKRYETDTQATDEKSKEKIELVRCDVCSQEFPTISKAITHKHKVHPEHDVKYFCPWCGKLFTMKHLYNVHVQSSHDIQDKGDGRRFHCDSCSVDFYVPSAMVNHNKFFHRQDTDLPDVGHSKKIKFYEQEIIPIYYCAFCGEEYENKVNLIKHMSDDHGDENQSPDEVLKCPLCEAVFYHLDAYEIHLTFHSSEDVYSVQNPEFDHMLGFSLETVPPIIEKVEILQNLETEDQNQEADAETAINAVGIEKFLELAMGQSEGSNPVKAKKHKKHKKSKKSAITLDEFLSMNQDVFGEGLDFQGIEEVPTRIVTNQLKNSKKSTNSAVTSAELDKLKKAGIVVKRKVNRNPLVKGLKVTTMPCKNIIKKPINKINQPREIETSNEVLTKLINQSNNQIKIVKKINPNTTTNEPKPTKSNHNDELETVDNKHENLNESQLDEMKGSPKPDSDNTKNLPSPKPAELLTSTMEGNLLTHNKFNESSVKPDAVNETINISNKNHESMQNVTKNLDSVHSQKCEGIVVTESPGVDKLEKNEPDEFDSDTEREDIEHKSDQNNCVNNNECIESNSINDNVISVSASSLSTLKHLSHLITVKPVIQNKNNISAEATTEKVSRPNSPEFSNTKYSSLVSINSERASPGLLKSNVDKDPTMDALKTLSKNITVKSLTTKNECEPEDDENDETQKISNNLKFHNVSCNKNISIKKNKIEASTLKCELNMSNALKNQEKRYTPVKQLNNKLSMGKIPNKIIVQKPDHNVPTANILKKLTNITTKPIMNRQSRMPPTIGQPKKSIETAGKKEEIIEIFDIDDSEDEIENDSKQPEPSQNSVKSVDALRNINKNITIKSLNQNLVNKNIKIEKDDNIGQNKINDESNTDTLMQNNSNSLKNVLQSLSKNITIKSRNTSPSRVQSQEKNTKDSQVLADNETSDSDSCPGNIKISENDEDAEAHGDSKVDSERNEFNTNLNQPIVESPKESCSENEDEHDFETDIKVSTVQKFNQSMNSTMNSVCLNNLKNINKNITIKSVSKSSINTGDDSFKQTEINDSQGTSHVTKKQLPTKKSNQSDNSNKISKNVDHSQTQSWNKKISAVNQVNTVNKEVTVKTIQTKTVIQEITTTVTKTIKTVNQTMKQEVRNSLQTNNPLVAQRIQGIRPSPAKNLQGVIIRHASHMLGPRTSNMLTQIRPVGTIVRPSKQIVSTRPGVNIVRPNNPRMVVGKKVTHSPSPNKHTIGMPLKISPSAVVATTISKRPNTEDVSGPFSCFKKPKESLIPVSDVPTFANIEGSAHYTSASHSSSSNFTSSTKVVKGNSVVAAKQVKSEVNSSSQKLSRFSNTTGIKIKPSQQQQSQVQDNSETSAMKRTTLEAIQKLQKQGLLVKKPRVDVNEGSEDSDHDIDNNVDYSSADENNE